MKYIVVLGDGMADYPIESIGGTPLEVANIPNINALAQKSEIGLVKTIPDGFSVGSDTANMSVLGYEPAKYYSGRSPLEALSMNLELGELDIAIRCNLVTLSDDEVFEEKTMVDYSAGEISSAEARVLISDLGKRIGDDVFSFNAGISYRHCLIIKGGSMDSILTPPHDISGQKIKNYLPKGVYADKFLSFYKFSYDFLSKHPVNLNRVRQGKKPANCIWLWGAGTKPHFDSFYSRYHKKGAVISAVDLLKGIARAADMQVVDVEGATGNWDTNYKNKALAALDALKTNDFCYIHIEAPDECGHRGELENKIYSIEQIDSQIVHTIVEGLSGEDFALLILPDHPTPMATRTHARDAVPYLMYSSKKCLGRNSAYNEKVAGESGIFYADAPQLMQKFLSIDEETL